MEEKQKKVYRLATRHKVNKKRKQETDIRAKTKESKRQIKDALHTHRHTSVPYKSRKQYDLSYCKKFHCS